MRHLYCLLFVLCVWALPEVARAEDWPQFRGPRRDNISTETGLLRKWPEGGPKVLWSTSACEGYAAAAIHSGKVYVNDYDRATNEWLVRCLKLDDGQELWRFKDEKRIRPNHGITRTVPAVDGKYVFSLDPKCVFHCLDAETGRELWRKNLVRDYQAKIPPWYNGQCPLIEEDRVILGVGGENALMIAFDKATGKEIWQTPNEADWPLSHSSVMPAELAGERQYVWCTLFGPLGVRASDGRLLWHHDRKFNVAVAPSPLAIGDGRVFMTSGYEAGSTMIRVLKEGESFKTETVFDLGGEDWNSETHTPILLDDHMFAVGRKKRGLFTCLDLNGQVVWDSGGHSSFDLGSYLLADGMFFVLEGKTGMLRLLEANTSEHRELDHAQVLSGHDVWGPMALSDGKLVLRDMEKMVCIEVGPAKQAQLDPPPAPPWKGGGLVGGGLTLAAYSEAQPKLYYRKTATIGGKGSQPGQFGGALRGLAVDKEDNVYAVGDRKLAVFSSTGKLLRNWSTERESYSVAVADDGRVFVGQAGQVRIFDDDGKLLDTWNNPDRLGLVTAIGFAGESVIVADVAGRCLRRFDQKGNHQGDIGKNNRMRGFLVPNRCLDFAVAPDSVVHVANSGMHRVQRYSLEDKLLGHFGRFGGRDPAGFTGCCNPTNLALTRDGLIVVTEKADPRVKVYDKDGELLAVFGVGDFDLNCKNMDVAVDSRGRVYVIDTARLHILVYEPAPPPATRAASAHGAANGAAGARGAASTCSAGRG